MRQIACRFVASAVVMVLVLGCRAEPPAPVQDHSRPAVSGRAADDVTWASLRVHRVGHGSGPVVVLLHGFGAPGDDLVQLARTLGVRGVRFVLPEAPLALAGGGRAWWPIDRRELMQARITGHPEDLAERHPPGLVEARRAIVDMLGVASERLRVPVSHMVLGGFSQGAITAMDVALHLSRPPAAVAVMSGGPVAYDDWGPRLPRLAGVPVLISHGREDPLLSFEAADRLGRELRDAGARVQWVPFDGGHAIPASVRARLASLIEHIRP